MTTTTENTPKYFEELWRIVFNATVGTAIYPTNSHSEYISIDGSSNVTGFETFLRTLLRAFHDQNSYQLEIDTDEDQQHYTFKLPVHFSDLLCWGNEHQNRIKSTRNNYQLGQRKRRWRLHPERKMPSLEPYIDEYFNNHRDIQCMVFLNSVAVASKIKELPESLLITILQFCATPNINKLPSDEFHQAVNALNAFPHHPTDELSPISSSVKKPGNNPSFQRMSFTSQGKKTTEHSKQHNNFIDTLIVAFR